MRKVLLSTICCLAASVAFGAPPRFEECRTLDNCLLAMDADAHGRPHGSGAEQDNNYRARLEAFGEPAKQALLKRAAGEDRGWSNLAGAILMDWKPLGPEDVPALIAALQREPGGWVARALGRIGAPEAIDALAEDVRLHSAASQSGWALSQIGDQVFPYLLPLLADDTHWHDAASIMRDMKSNALHGRDAWLAIALDSKRSERDRVGALRGIGVLGTSAKQVAPSLRILLAANDGYGPIPETARKTLAAMGDETMALETAAACVPSTDAFEGSLDSSICLERAAVFGSGILPYANFILTMFTNSRTGVDRANGASILGFIGYAPARERLIELLKDSDWRVVYAAARSLGWLGAKDAVQALAAVAEDHWLGDVRDEAVKVIAALNSSSGVLARPTARAGTLNHPPDLPALEINATFAPDIAPCESGRWVWDGHEFREPDNASPSLHITARGGLPAGTLTGRDSGEWGGEVKWESASAAPLFVVYGNVEGIKPNRDGAVAIIGSGGIWTSYEEKRAAPSSEALETFTISNGPGGSGYAVGLRRDESGAWRVNEIARFPRTAFGLTTIGDELFAVWSGNRAIVFTPNGILGVAQCLVPR